MVHIKHNSTKFHTPAYIEFEPPKSSFYHTTPKLFDLIDQNNHKNDF